MSETLLKMWHEVVSFLEVEATLVAVEVEEVELAVE